MEIDKSLYIPRDDGYDALLSYGPNIEINLLKESFMLDMAHASHGVYKTSFVASDIRYIEYWFAKKNNLNQFIRLFDRRKKEDNEYKNWNLEDFSENRKQIFDISEYGLLADKILI